MIIDELIAFPLVAVLFGALFSMLLCIAYSRRRRPPLWLSPLPAFATGLSMFLCAFGGPSIFTGDFWEGFNSVLEPGLNILIFTCFVFGAIGLIPSLAVIAIYRSLRKPRVQ